MFDLIVKNKFCLMGFFVFVYSAFIYTSEDFELDLYTNTSEVVPHTAHTYRRFYFVERLRKTMELLNRIQSVTAGKKDFFDSLKDTYRFCCSTTSFNCQRIRDSMDEIIQTKTLKPLFMVWGDFARYRSIQDEIFVEDFTKEVFIISRSVIDLFSFRATERSIVLYNANVDNYLRGIEQINNELEQIVTRGICEESQLHRNLEDVRPGVDTEKIMHRFYHVGRLATSVQKIKQLSTWGILEDKISVKKVFGGISFEHKRINYVLKTIPIIGVAQAVYELWEDLQQFKYIEDNDFLNETLRFMFWAYHYLFTTYGRAEYAALETQKVQKLALHIDELKTEQLHKAVDVVCIGIIKSFPEQLENNDNIIIQFMQNGWSWFKKLITSLLVKVGKS